MLAIEIKVKIEGLNQLTESLALIGSALAYKNNMVNTSAGAVDLLLDVTDKVEDCTKEEKVKKEVIKEVVSEVTKPPKKESKEPKEEKVEEVKSKFTREDVRAAFVEKNSPSTRNQLKAILDKFEAPNISELKEEHFEDAMKELEAI